MCTINLSLINSIVLKLSHFVVQKVTIGTLIVPSQLLSIEIKLSVSNNSYFLFKLRMKL